MTLNSVPVIHKQKDYEQKKKLPLIMQARVCKTAVVLLIKKQWHGSTISNELKKHHSNINTCLNEMLQIISFV